MKKLLMITFRQSLEHDLSLLFKEIGLTTYTMIPGVFGMGDSGSVPSTFGWPGVNSILLVVLDEEQEASVVEKLKEFRSRLAEDQPHMRIPLRLFVLPCDQII